MPKPNLVSLLVVASATLAPLLVSACNKRDDAAPLAPEPAVVAATTTPSQAALPPATTPPVQPVAQPVQQAAAPQPKPGKPVAAARTDGGPATAQPVGWPQIPGMPHPSAVSATASAAAQALPGLPAALPSALPNVLPTGIPTTLPAQPATGTGK